MVHPIHKQLREIRMQNNELLKDMADKLGLGSAELSSIENGRKPLPEGFMQRVEELYESNTIVQKTSGDTKLLNGMRGEESMDKDNIMAMEYTDRIGGTAFEMVAVYNQKKISKLEVLEVLQSKVENVNVVKMYKEQFDNIFK